MAILDDSVLTDANRIDVVNSIGRRDITHVVHDIDGTHSLIREWPPVMSLSIHWAMTCGLPDNFDSDATLAVLIERVGAVPLPETDQFCIESAGLSAITQMEYGIRRAIELGNVPDDAGFALTKQQRANNAEIVQRIWRGEERFDDIEEPAALRRFIDERTPRLFVLYEKILNGACRDRNTADAWTHPDKWRVPGSMAFMQHLRDVGCVNHFVTGAVIYEDGGMFEEVRAVGFEVGAGRLVESLRGSRWDRKMPKDEVMAELLAELGVDAANVLVIGDGRTEIAAGVAMGSVCLSRLPRDAIRQRELHTQLGTNYIVEDYTDPVLHQFIRKG